MKTLALKSMAFPLLLLSVPLSLGGCGLLRAHHDVAMLPAVEDPAMQARLALDQGRRALDADQPGQAIEAFVNALGDRSTLAPALNGLGVAYARLGSLDSARRMFEEAASIAPDRPEFVANLTHLRDVLTQADAAPAPAAPPPEARPAADSRLTRLSAHEVLVHGAPLEASGRKMPVISPLATQRTVHVAGPAAATADPAEKPAQAATAQAASVQKATGRSRLVINPYPPAAPAGESNPPVSPQS